MNFNKQVVATSWIKSKSIEKYARKLVEKFLIFQRTVILNEGQGVIQNVVFSDLYRQIKFERNWSVNVQIKTKSIF